MRGTRLEKTGLRGDRLPTGTPAARHAICSLSGTTLRGVSFSSHFRSTHSLPILKSKARNYGNVQTQGTNVQRTQKDVVMDRGELERSAQMFEMILQSSPEAVENYLTLKDLYRRLDRREDFKRVVTSLAQAHLDSKRPELAAKEYIGLLEIDPKDAEALSKLEEIGYSGADLPALRAEIQLQEVQARCKEKLRELDQAEQAFLKASAKARDARRGEDEEISSLLKGIEEKVDSEMGELVTEREHWLAEGRTEVLNQVTESLSKKADNIIQDDEFNDIRKSVKKAEKLLASRDKAFEEEWQRLSEERERDFQEKTEELKDKKETQLRSTWQGAVVHAEQAEAAADLALRKVKEELRELQVELRGKEMLVQKRERGLPEKRPPSSPKTKLEKPDIVVVASHSLESVAEPSGEGAPQPTTASKTSKDEVGKALGAILVQHGLVTREHLEEAIARQAKDHKPLGQILVECGYATEEDIINALVAQAGVPYLPLANYQIPDDVAAVIPKETALKYSLMPADRIANTLLISMGIPLDERQKHEVEQHVGGLKIRYFISSWSDIKAKHEEHYS